jgi:hypothetical protein
LNFSVLAIVLDCVAHIDPKLVVFRSDRSQYVEDLSVILRHYEMNIIVAPSYSIAFTCNLTALSCKCHADPSPASVGGRQPPRCTRQCATRHAIPQYRVFLHTQQRFLPPPSQPGLAQYSRTFRYAICAAVAPDFVSTVIAVLPAFETALTFAPLWTRCLMTEWSLQKPYHIEVA